jgi:hypothetical protein
MDAKSIVFCTMATWIAFRPLRNNNFRIYSTALGSPNPRISIKKPSKQFRQPFSVYLRKEMPDKLTESEINSKTDPSVAKQYDTETSTEQQIKDFFKAVDSHKIGMLNTYRNNVGKFLFYEFHKSKETIITTELKR